MCFYLKQTLPCGLLCHIFFHHLKDHELKAVRWVLILHEVLHKWRFQVFVTNARPMLGHSYSYLPGAGTNVPSFTKTDY